jgi:hypothetical protein
MLNSLAGFIAVLSNTVAFICPTKIQMNYRSTDCQSNNASPNCFCNQKRPSRKLGEDEKFMFKSALSAVKSAVSSKISDVKSAVSSKISDGKLKEYLFGKVKALGGEQIRKLIVHLVDMPGFFTEQSLDCICESFILPWADGES